MFVVDAGTIYDARVGVKSGDGWDLYVFGRNLGSERFPRDLFPTPFQTGGLWQVLDSSAHKLVGLQFDMKF
jgi:iron complex outermembrane recepter protein